MSAEVAKVAVQRAFIHAADISGQALCGSLSTAWSDRILLEFKAQHAEEAALGLPLTPMMVGLDDPAVAGKMQHGFALFVLKPLFTALRMLFPELQPLEEQVGANAAAFLSASNAQ